MLVGHRLTFAVVADFALGLDVAAEHCAAPFASYPDVRRALPSQLSQPIKPQRGGQLWAYLLQATMERILAPVKYWRVLKTPAVRKYDAARHELTRLIDRAVEQRLAVRRCVAHSARAHLALLGCDVET
jgi:hypothetical protein